MAGLSENKEMLIREMGRVVRQAFSDSRIL